LPQARDASVLDALRRACRQLTPESRYCQLASHLILKSGIEIEAEKYR
jgi:hypothetical protein